MHHGGADEQDAADDTRGAVAQADQQGGKAARREVEAEDHTPTFDETDIMSESRPARDMS